MPGFKTKRENMDLRLYYQKIRDEEARIAEDFPIVVSNESADGGKGGTKTEVPRWIAAKMVVEGLARLAYADEIIAYRAFLAEAKRVADQVAQAARLQLTVLSTEDLERLKGPARKSKD
jgi:hypothetical protein